MRIRIQEAKRAIKEGKNSSTRQIIWHKKDKNNVIATKWGP
jgi:hypothetical protein